MKKTGVEYYWVRENVNDYDLVSVTYSEEARVHEAKSLKDSTKGLLMQQEDVLGPVNPPLCAKTVLGNEDEEKTLVYLIERFFMKSEKTKEILELSLIEKMPDKKIAETLDLKQSGISRILGRFKKHAVCQDCHKNIPIDYAPIGKGYYWCIDRQNQLFPIYVYEIENILYVKTESMRKNSGMLPLSNFDSQVLAKIEAPISEEDRKTLKGVFRAFSRITKGGKRPHKATCKAIVDLMSEGVSINNAAKKHKVSPSSVARFNKKINGEFCYSCGQLKKDD